MSIKSIDDLPAPGGYHILIINDDQEMMLKVLEKLEELGWIWSGGMAPTAYSKISYALILGNDDAPRLFNSGGKGMPSDINAKCRLRVSQFHTGSSQPAGSSDLCPHCGRRMEFVNLALKCPQCWYMPR